MEKKEKKQLLLLEDIRNLGRKGDLVKAKPGFIRNFLLPNKKAVIASKQTIVMQKRLQEEREKQAVEDKKKAEVFAARIKDKVFIIKAKTDPLGHLYGSVSSGDIAKLITEEEGVEIEKRSILLFKPIKKTGTYEISLKLEEEVLGSCTVKVVGEGVVEEIPPKVEVVEEGEKEPEKPLFTEDAGETFPRRSEREAAVRDEVEERTKE